MIDTILTALQTRHKAEMQTALANIKVYENSVGIGEHPDVVEAVDTQVARYVEAKERYEAIKELLNKSLEDD